MSEIKDSDSNNKVSSEGKYKPATSLRELIAAPKGNLSHEKGESFLLHVFWEAPSTAAAIQLLEGLKQCANATHRDTPCVATYFFRISQNDTAICVKSLTVGDHQQIIAARKKIQRGASPMAVHAELKKRGIDISYLDADDSTLLPEDVQVHPVAVEFTEVYLDERGFMEHSGSRDFLDGYGVVTNPAMHNRTPVTLRLGTPPIRVVETILEPMLKEDVRSLSEGSIIWRKPVSRVDNISLFWSLDFFSLDGSVDKVVNSLPDFLRKEATTCVAFIHPNRPDTVRVMIVIPLFPTHDTLVNLATAAPLRGEVHVLNGLTQVSAEDLPAVEELRASLHSVGLDTVVLVNCSASVGYALHEKALQLVQKE